jgi:hypothetical protein
VLPGEFYGTDLALDGDGHRHITATDGGGHLWYATDRSGAWVSGIILRGGSGARAYEQPSIALDVHGRVHIAVVDGNGIWYVTDQGRARGDFGTRRRVAGPMTEGPSLRVQDGVRYLAYHRAFDTATGSSAGSASRLPGVPLFFKTDRGGTWTREIIASYGYAPSLRVGADGRARIAYIGVGGVRFVEARTPLGRFKRSVRVAGSTGADQVSLALGARGQPQLAWTQYRDYSAWYARRSRHGWPPPRLLGRGGVVESSIDARGRPHVAFATPTRVVHRWRGRDGWERRVVASGVKALFVQIRAYGRGASMAWSQRDVPRGIWVLRDGG